MSTDVKADGPRDITGRTPRSKDEFDVKDVYADEPIRVLIGYDTIQERVEELAHEITEDYEGRDLYPICVLKGAYRFYTDLRSNMDVNTEDAFVNASRYGTHQTAQTTEVETRFIDRDDIAGKDVLFVEDIVDEGYTAKTLMEEVERFEPNSVNIVTLLDKQENREVPVDIGYTGFTISDEFVLGYGLDYEERYRSLDHVCVMRPDGPTA